MSKKYHNILAIAGIFCILLFTGCQKLDNDKNAIISKNVDWTQGFVRGDITAVHEMSLYDYFTDEKDEKIKGECVARFLLPFGENSYEELKIYQSENSYHYYFKEQAIDGATPSVYSIGKNEWDMEDTVPIFFDALDDKFYFGIESNGGKQKLALPEHIYIIITDIDGHSEKTVDVKEGLESLGCKNRPSGMYTDSDGYFYFMGSEENTTLYVIDSEGKGILTYECKRFCT